MGRHGRMRMPWCAALITISDRAQHARTCKARWCVRRAAFRFAALGSIPTLTAATMYSNSSLLCPAQVRGASLAILSPTFEVCSCPWPSFGRDNCNTMCPYVCCVYCPDPVWIPSVHACVDLSLVFSRQYKKCHSCSGQSLLLPPGMGCGSG